jgi:hypothetical protein
MKRDAIDAIKNLLSAPGQSGVERREDRGDYEAVRRAWLRWASENGHEESSSKPLTSRENLL